MPSDSKQSSTQAGFSLIELLVVLAIIAIVALVGISQVAPKSPRAVRSALTELRGAFQQARQLARSSGREVILALDNSAFTITLAPVGSDGKVDTSGGSNVIYQTIRLSSDFRRYAQFVNSKSSLGGAEPAENIAILSNFGFSSWDKPLDSSMTLSGTKHYAFSNDGRPILVDGTARSSLTGGFWLGVTGTSPNNTGVPMGMVIAGQDGLVAAFYKPDSQLTTADYKWQRLE